MVFYSSRSALPSLSGEEVGRGPLLGKRTAAAEVAPCRTRRGRGGRGRSLGLLVRTELHLQQRIRGQRVRYLLLRGLTLVGVVGLGTEVVV